MREKLPGSSAIYWMIGVTPITATLIYFAFGWFGIDIGLPGLALMIVLLLAIKIVLWFVLRIFYSRSRSDEGYG